MAILLGWNERISEWGDLVARLSVLRSCSLALKEPSSRFEMQDIQCWCSWAYTSVQVSAGPTRLGCDDRINKIIPNTYV
ncbi:hypothetical protein ELI37_13140 [Rhizobium leguminosarum]|uniref:hypothetical protein n=1 Tax=Rhizobium leguminosarum TaxID=384 RepID=UPI0010323439|nr:hypothetical protein [Rhizobium leguminosarum]TAV11349.1 hypothetical protein ELI37_13140 [Rhizobium leguminosarum]